MTREEILPTYKIPALVRAPEGQVEVSGFEHRGTVYLAWDSEEGFYWGYWDLLPDGPP